VEASADNSGVQMRLKRIDRFAPDGRRMFQFSKSSRPARFRRTGREKKTEKIPWLKRN
jgi:hypothetical protein